MCHIVFAACEIVVYAKNIVASIQESLAKMRPKKSGPSRHKYAFLYLTGAHFHDRLFF